MQMWNFWKEAFHLLVAIFRFGESQSWQNDGQKVKRKFGWGEGVQEVQNEGGTRKALLVTLFQILETVSSHVARVTPIPEKGIITASFSVPSKHSTSFEPRIYNKYRQTQWKEISGSKEKHITFFLIQPLHPSCLTSSFLLAFSFLSFFTIYSLEFRGSIY